MNKKRSYVIGEVRDIVKWITQGKTVDYISAKLGRPKKSVEAQIGELRKAGLI